jgi:hypothetical protein
MSGTVNLLSPVDDTPLAPLRTLKEIAELDDADLKPWTDYYSDILGPFLSKRRKRE